MKPTMTKLKYVKPEKLSLKEHPELNERWIQDRIAEDPTLLGLGELILKDRERNQTRAGRLDLLLQDPESLHRYEVEIQLGKTDETHIIRTIEYWDLERKRYPQYDHSAVIVAEDITSRFLNVISLFNGFIPVIAIQMTAFKLGDQISLAFTTVLGEMRLGLVDEDEGVSPSVDRSYWEKLASPTTLATADTLLDIIRQWDPGFALNYTKRYIGLTKDGLTNNFATFYPKKEWLRLLVKVETSTEEQAKLEEAGLDLMPSGPRYGGYRIRLAKGDVKQHEEVLTGLVRRAYEEAVS